MPRGQLTTEQIARKLAALASPETKAKMRAAKLGRSQSPEQVAKRVAPRIGKPLSPEHRQKVSAAQRGRPLTPDHLAAVRAAHGRPEFRAAMRQAFTGRPLSTETKRKISSTKTGRALTPEHRDAISRGQVRAYETGRRTYNGWEQRAAALLLPLGYSRFPRHGGHAFDFGNDTTLVEVNSCRYHDHRRLKPSCPTTPKPDTFPRDEACRAIARAIGMPLIELWACEEADWPRLIGIPASGA